MNGTNQYTREWWLARRGHITSSRMARVIYGTHKGWSTLMDEMQAELESDEPPLDPWRGKSAPKAIRWGHQWEDAAIDNAALDLSWDVIRPPFVESPSVPYIGASSDAIVLRGLDPIENVEVKCPLKESQHTRVVMNQQVPAEHYPQIAAQIFTHGFDISHFVSYNPKMPDHRSRLCVLRFERDHKLEQEMLNRCADFYDIFSRGDRPKPRQVPRGTGFPSVEF